MKYGELTFGQMEAVVNKLGGMDGVASLLADEMVVTKKEVKISASRARSRPRPDHPCCDRSVRPLISRLDEGK